MRTRGWLNAAALSLMLAGCGGDSGRETGIPPVPPKRVAHVREPLKTGEALFRQNCSACHPEGGNVSDPARSLHRAALRAHHIHTADDIIHIMRHPISRMIRFDRSALSDEDARAIAEYVLTTFK